ncbi:MAG: hypothetical protein DRG71_10060 [Deltaproteobacteria bacterium]|nr:MAG: hypothetical protein DRG71_10060 [Deltaproteobacteria bacterium]
MTGQFYKSRRSRILILIICITLANLLQWHPNARAISIEKETELGNKFLASIKKHFEFLNDEFAQDYINRLGEALAQEIEVKPFPFHYYIVKQNDLNAFAGPGGHIFIYSGLISSMDDVDELAGVLAHEMGHITARHLSKRIEQGKKISIATMAAVLAGIFIGGKAGAALTTGSVAAGIQTQLHYSREDERQADQLGFKYGSLAGFDPSGLIRALTIIQKNSWMESNKIPPYLRTHPTGPQRIANLESMLHSFRARPNHDAETLRKQFPVFKTLVQAKSNDPDKMEQIFKKDLEDGRNVSLAHLGLGIVYKIKSEYAESVRHLRAALGSMPSSVVIWRELGEAYQLTGQYQEALPLLERILAQRPNDRKAMLLLAESYENLGQYGKAISLLKTLSFADRVAPEVYYHLGMSYGRLKKLALAHFYLGLYFKELGRREKARFHFTEARRLSKGNLSLQRKIKRVSKGIL